MNRDRFRNIVLGLDRVTRNLDHRLSDIPQNRGRCRLPLDKTLGVIRGLLGGFGGNVRSLLSSCEFLDLVLYRDSIRRCLDYISETRCRCWLPLLDETPGGIGGLFGGFGGDFCSSLGGFLGGRRDGNVNGNVCGPL